MSLCKWNYVVWNIECLFLEVYLSVHEIEWNNQEILLINTLRKVVSKLNQVNNVD